MMHKVVTFRRGAAAVLLLNIVLFVLSVSGGTAPVIAQDTPRADPTGTWETLSPSNSPIARHETSFVYAGGRFYLIGGRESQKVQIYDPSTNAWTDGANAPITMHHIQPVTVDGLIYAVAAYSGTCCDSEFGASNVYVYDPVQNKWFQMTPIPSNRRRGAVGVVYYQNKFYAVGGLNGGHGGSAQSFNYFDVYDPAAGTWQALPDAPHDRDHFGAAVVGGALYAIGGRTSVGSGYFNKTVPEIDVFSFATNTWVTLPSTSNIPSQRAGTAVAVLNSEILVIGGEGFGNAYPTTEAFNPVTGVWRTLASMNQQRHGTTAAVCNNVVYIAAGSPNQGGGVSNTLERYFQQTAAACPAETITPGQLSVAGDSAFGQVAIGSPVTRTLTISDTGGTQGMIVRSINQSGSSEFTVADNVSFPIVIAPGAALTLQVAYMPTGTGQDTGALTVNYERPGSPLQISLSGEGVTAPAATSTPVSGTPTTTPPTTPQAALNLVENGGFEQADPLDDTQALFWKADAGSNGKRATNRMGHPTKPDKVIAYSGTAAYQLKTASGLDSKIVQKIEPVLVAPQVDQILMVDLWAKVKKVNAVEDARIKVKVAYADGTKDSLNVDLSNTVEFAYSSFANSLPLTSVQLSKLKVIVQVRESGSVYIDEMRVRVCGGAYLCS
jgi:hypothetical protein